MCKAPASDLRGEYVMPFLPAEGDLLEPYGLGNLAYFTDEFG